MSYELESESMVNYRSTGLELVEDACNTLAWLGFVDRETLAIT